MRLEGTGRVGRAIAAMALAIVLSGHAAAQEPSTLALLDQYASGKFADVNAVLAKTENFKRIYKDLKHDDVKAWLAKGGSGDRARRELAAATFALEAARADEWYEWKWHQRQTTIGEGGGSSMSKLPVLYWLPPPALIEWGCELLRQNLEPSATEHIWQLAAMAVGQRSEDTEFLVGFTKIEVLDPMPAEAIELLPPPQAPPLPPSVGGIRLQSRGADRGPDEVLNLHTEFNHLNHVLERFPNEKRFELGQALARERAESTDAIKVYQSLMNDPMVGGEAAVRLGALLLRRGTVPNALQILTRAEALTRDPDMVYLARFYRGQAQLRNRQEDAAVAAFRGALAARPGSQSASVALASILARREQRTEAQSIMKAVLDKGSDYPDPHIEYAHGDDRFWPELIARLHKEIAR